MRHDRTGEEIDDDESAPEPRKPRCHRCDGSGWLGYDDELRPIPCECKDHLLGGTAVINDCADQQPSLRAQRAIGGEPL